MLHSPKQEARIRQKEQSPFPKQAKKVTLSWNVPVLVGGVLNKSPVIEIVRAEWCLVCITHNQVLFQSSRGEECVFIDPEKFGAK